ncbi:MAG: hypothetical protein J5850_02825, partial [Clostridia bacterium]|nr:hypothetical protein [Clostridia bacterium]
ICDGGIALPRNGPSQVAIQVGFFYQTTPGIIFISDHGIAVYRTDISGDIVISVSGNLKVE